MSVKHRKEIENTRLKEKILSATTRIFAEQGYGKVSMRKIAALIDYSPTTIYRFFRNKEELLLTIAAGTYKDLAAKFEKILGEKGGHPLGTLKSLVREYIFFCVERADMFRMFSDLASFETEDGIMYERLEGSRHQVYQSWFRGIKQSLEAGALEVKDEVRIFLFLWDAVNGYIDHRINQPQVARKPLAEDAEEFLSLVFRGIETIRNN